MIGLPATFATGSRFSERLGGATADCKAEALPDPDSGLCTDDIAAAPTAVLDTQVVLDWLVFNDPAVVPVVRALRRGGMRWIATPAMHAELMHVLGRGVGAARRSDAAAVSRRFLRWSKLHPAAPPAGPALRCSDPDDQMFIDLALAARARWLFSRDRAVLALARGALRHDILVLRPSDWTAASAAR